MLTDCRRDPVIFGSPPLMLARCTYGFSSLPLCRLTTLRNAINTSVGSTLGKWLASQCILISTSTKSGY